MKTFARGAVWLALLLSYLNSWLPAHAAAPWTGPLMQRGIAALSCGGAALDNTGTPIPIASSYTFGLADLRTPPVAMYGPCNSSPGLPLTVPLWNAPMFHDPTWTVENLGNLFGLTIDATGSVYAAAHGLYGTYQPLHHRYGNLGGGATSLTAAGTVYKIDGVTGVATVFAVIPGQQTMFINASLSSGPGLGNIAYDKVNNQFFVSSLEDGKIYRVNAAGTVVNSFDPLTADNGAPGMPPRSERVWAVEVLNNEVYYSIWNDGDTTNPGIIRRVSLNGSGDFIGGSDVAVLTVPGQTYVMSGGTPVVDLTFSLDGQTMILGCRTMQSDTTSYNHNSPSHMAKLVGVTWSVVRTQRTGCNVPDGEAYGGVAYGEEGGTQDAVIWTTSADMAVNYGPHGAFGVRTGDFAVSGQATNSWKVPYMPSFLNDYRDDRKGSGGDIEIFRLNDKCADLVAGPVSCPTTNGGTFTFTLNITNHSSSNIHYIWMTPCPTSSLPAGAITAQPTPAGIVILPTPLAPGAGTSITVTLPGNVGGQTVCFRVTLLDREGKSCCTEKICIDVPACDCANVLDRHIDCEPQADGTIKYTITLTIQNLTHLSGNPYGFAYVSILPPTGFSPTFAIPTPNPIPPGGTGTVQLTYFGTPGPICFNLGLHDETLEECCSPQLICLDLPKCPPASDKPDTCSVETKVPCCPPAPGLATINYTICNNSTVPRTYSWNISPSAAPGCSNMLTAASFFPASGTLGPIPPGGCMTLPITVRCDGFKAGDCAGFRVCASYNAAVPPLCCEGTVYRPKQGDPVVKDIGAAGTVAAIPVGGSAVLAFDITNPTTGPLTFDFYMYDGLGVLTYDAADGGAPASTYTTLVTVDTGSTQRVSVVAHRLDNGVGTPDFTGVEVWTSLTGPPGAADPILVVPVRLLPPSAPLAPSIKSLHLVTVPSPKVVVTMGTTAGKRYRVEQAPEVTGPWTAATCATTDTTIDPEGYIIGTGGNVSCSIDCNPGSNKMFFRLTEQN